MLALRTAIGLTQAGLADLLRVSRHAVGGWEAGQTYPKPDHLKALIALGMRQGAFPSGREAVEIRALWQAARQKVLLDERWLQELLSHPAALLIPEPAEQVRAVGATSARDAKPELRVDWDDALDVPSLYGRAGDLALLARWVAVERCRVVSVLGMGGIGKSALAVTVMRQVAAQFEVVIWRSLRDAPACEALLESCLRVLAPQLLPATPATLEGRLQLLIAQLRDRRVLLVLDNLEALLEEGIGTGRMRAGAEGYASMLRRIAETAHQSCLLLTSREKPAELVSPEGSSSPVRAVRLAGIEAGAGAQLLVERDVVGTAPERERLAELYGGNPLALKIVARTIVDLFGGEIAPFLAQGEMVFGGVRELLDEQIDRLSALDQTVVYWLAILREPASLAELSAVLGAPWARMSILEALEGLLRRSLIVHGQRAGSFTLQSVVLEYMTARLIAEVSGEIEHGNLSHLIAYGLCLAHAKEYVRKAQEQLLVAPLLAQLQRTYQGQAAVEARLLDLLGRLRDRDKDAQGYGPANLLALLHQLRGDLRGLDLARLFLRGVSLQGVEMQDARLSGAVLQDGAFTEAFDAIRMVAVTKDGQYWVAGSRRGELRVWSDAGRTLHRVWQAHLSDMTAIALSPDGRTLASVSFDATVKLWNVERGTLLWASKQPGAINAVAFAPGGLLLASGGNDGRVHVWNAQSGTEVQTFADQSAMISSLAWSPDARLLASGCADGSIWLWDRPGAAQGSQPRKLAGHRHWVSGLVFAPGGAQLASAGFDGAVKLWDSARGEFLRTVSEHSAPVLRVVWSPDGRTLASCNFDHSIFLWDVAEVRPQTILYGHAGVIHGLAFTPDSGSLLSASDDGTIRVWDVARGQSLRVLGGYVATLLDVDWSPDGTRLATAGADTMVSIWSSAGAAPPSRLRGHRWIVQGVAWSPDGQLLASGGYDNSVGLWDAATGVRLRELRDSDAADTLFLGVAWSPDGRLLACGSYQRGVHVWDTTTYTRRWVGQAGPTLIRRVAWNPAGTQLAGAGGDGYVYVWDVAEGRLIQRLAGQDGAIVGVAWSPDGARLAAAGAGRAGAELFVWDMAAGEQVQTIPGHPGLITAIAWGPGGDTLISGGSDGMLRWWEIERGECRQVCQGHTGNVQALKRSPDLATLASCGDDGAIVLWDIRSGERLQTLRRDRPYERMDIAGLTGITDAQRASLVALGAVDRPAEPAVLVTPAPRADADHARRGGHRPASNLPLQPTAFIGRSQELGAIAKILANPSCRLLTLTGPGGIGKTRLALEIAVAQTAAYADGVAFVALAAVDTPRQLVSAIGDSLGLTFADHRDPTAHLLGELRERHMLLVLDNFEHLLDSVDLVSDVLARAPQVSLIVTSRERLNLQAEWLFDLRGLDYPLEDPRGSAPAQRQAHVADYGAVKLFVQRATQVQSALVLDEAALLAIAHICRHVAGMPLAIELAAAGARTLPFAEIERQIRTNLDALVTTMRDVPTRHRSLRAVFDHSWKLLDTQERVLLSRLAVFRGGWAMAAAAEIAGATPPVLTALVKSRWCARAVWRSRCWRRARCRAHQSRASRCWSRSASLRWSGWSRGARRRRSSTPTRSTFKPWPKRSPHSGAPQSSIGSLLSFCARTTTCAPPWLGLPTAAIASLGCGWPRPCGSSGAATAISAKGGPGWSDSWRWTLRPATRAPAPRANTACMPPDGWRPTSTTTTRPRSSLSPAWRWAKSAVKWRARPMCCSTRLARRARRASTSVQPLFWSKRWRGTARRGTPAQLAV